MATWTRSPIKLLAIGVIAVFALTITAGESHSAPATQTTAAPYRALPLNDLVQSWIDVPLGRLGNPLAYLPPPRFTSIRGHAGFWRLARNRQGVWWFLSPAGQTEFINSVTTVQPVLASADSTGAHYVARDYTTDDIAHGNLNRWADATVNRILSIGFKGLGAWSNPVLHQYPIPMTQDLNLWTWVNPAARRLYSPQWITQVESAVKLQVSSLKDNANLVGYYTDNELDWGDGSSGPGLYFNNLPADDPNRRQVVQVIHQLWPTIDGLNTSWNTAAKSYADVDAWPALPREPTNTYNRLASAWLNHLAGDYFRMTTALIHQYDPNHLILGVRFRGFAPLEVVKASHDFTDAQSLNYYVGDARLDADMFAAMNRASGQPIVISEYSFHSLDGRSGDRDVVGFAGQVPDQQARADGYRLMTTRLARVPYVVGADWFQWCDEPPAGRDGDGEDVNFGIIDITDHPYDALTNAIRQTAPQLNPLHSQSYTDAGADIWRENFSTRPVMHVPLLSKTPALDGDLRKWSLACKVPSIRSATIVGLDRLKSPVPNIFLGWTPAGLCLAMEVFADQIETADAKGAWWTRDYVEFFLSTQPVASNQTAYDVNCHQFFFVPSGETGLSGQWHRDGDALQNNLIPHPLIKHAMKSEPGRYVVEMLIPTQALHGFDPQHQPALAFNIHIHKFHDAADFFWSAPKEVQTQLRPNTWGTLYLDGTAVEHAMLMPNAERQMPN